MAIESSKVNARRLAGLAICLLIFGCSRSYPTEGSQDSLGRTRALERAIAEYEMWRTDLAIRILSSPDAEDPPSILLPHAELAYALPAFDPNHVRNAGKTIFKVRDEDYRVNRELFFQLLTYRALYFLQTHDSRRARDAYRPLCPQDSDEFLACIDSLAAKTAFSLQIGSDVRRARETAFMIGYVANSLSPQPEYRELMLTSLGFINPPQAFQLEHEFRRHGLMTESATRALCESLRQAIVRRQAGADVRWPAGEQAKYAAQCGSQRMPD